MNRDSQKQRIDIEPIKEAMEVIKKFNSLDLREVQLYENNEPAPMENLKEFQLLGLSNRDYIRFKIYSDGLEGPIE